MNAHFSFSSLPKMNNNIKNRVLSFIFIWWKNLPRPLQARLVPRPLLTFVGNLNRFFRFIYFKIFTRGSSILRYSLEVAQKHVRYHPLTFYEKQCKAKPLNYWYLWQMGNIKFSESSWVFATNSNFLIPISLQADCKPLIFQT